MIMNSTIRTSPPAGTAQPDPSAVRAAAFAGILGEADLERTERHIRTLRRLTELALGQAERLDRVAEAQATRAEGQAGARLVEEASAEALQQPRDEQAGTEQPGGQPTADEHAADGVSLALYRLARMARLNIALEQKLIDDL